MSGGIADIVGEGRFAVSLNHAVDQLFASGESFVPGDFAPLFALADHRRAKPVVIMIYVP